MNSGKTELTEYSMTLAEGAAEVLHNDLGTKAKHAYKIRRKDGKKHGTCPLAENIPVVYQYHNSVEST